MPSEIEPTRRERVIIWRRRNGLTQGDAALRHGVSHRRWGRWERGTEAPGTDKEIGRLLVHEQLYLLRRRRGVSQQEVATALGCTRAWVQQMETGQCGSEPLLRYWEEISQSQGG